MEVNEGKYWKEKKDEEGFEIELTVECKMLAVEV